MGTPSSFTIMLQLVSRVGVNVGVDVRVGASDVGLLVSVNGSDVVDGRGVKVSKVLSKVPEKELKSLYGSMLEGVKLDWIWKNLFGL